MEREDVRPEQIAVGQVWRAGDGFSRKITSVVHGDVYFDGRQANGLVIAGRLPLNTLVEIINGDNEELIDGALAN